MKSATVGYQLTTSQRDIVFYFITISIVAHQSDFKYSDFDMFIFPSFRRVLKCHQVQFRLRHASIVNSAHQLWSLKFGEEFSVITDFDPFSAYHFSSALSNMTVFYSRLHCRNQKVM